MGEALSWHGVRKSCRTGLQLALEAELEDRSRTEFQLPICLLLALGQHRQAFNLLRWWVSSAGARPRQVLRCGQAEHLQADMAQWREGEGWSPAMRWSRDADVGEDLVWLLGREGRNRGPASKPAKLLVGLEECDYLHTALPVAIVTIAELERCKMIHQGLFAFLMGTHHRLGHESPVMRIIGLTPVIRRIAKFWSHQPELEQRELKLRLNLADLVWMCRPRGLLLGLVESGRPSMWTFGLCTMCIRGGDCETGVTCGIASESELREREPLSFVLLEFAMRSIFLENTEHMVKSLMMSILGQARQFYLDG